METKTQVIPRRYIAGLEEKLKELVSSGADKTQVQQMVEFINDQKQAKNDLEQNCSKNDLVDIILKLGEIVRVKEMELQATRELLHKQG